MSESKKKIKIKLKADPVKSEDPVLAEEFRKAEMESVTVPKHYTTEDFRNDMKRIEEKVDNLTGIILQVKSMLEEAKAKSSVDFLKKF